MKKMLKSYDPSNGELVGEVEITSLYEIEDKVIQSRAALSEWKKTTFEKRVNLLRKAGEKIGEKAEELGVLLSREMGKDIRRSMGEVQGCASDAIHKPELVAEALKPRETTGYSKKTRIEYHPYGVCAVISPWNFPMAMANWMIIPALAAGNTVVFKPSEETPLIAQAYADILTEVLPKNVLQIVQGSEAQGRALVDANVNMIAFTGSHATGKEIMKSASKDLKRLIMELGGKDPLIVLEDADIEKSARFAVAGSFENAGQVCTSVERIFVDEKIADKFEKRVVEIASGYRTGPWNSSSANIGPIINEKQRSVILKHINDSLDKGATALLGGRDHPERYVTPTVITGVTDNMLITREETFGPVAAITRYKNLDDAINSANSTTFGLGSSVFGSEKAVETANRIESGMVGINQGPGGGDDLPWVGAKQSGYGFHGSPDGHKQFAQIKLLSIS